MGTAVGASFSVSRLISAGSSEDNVANRSAKISHSNHRGSSMRAQSLPSSCIRSVATYGLDLLAFSMDVSTAT